MNYSRYDHAVSLLVNGKVLVSSGFNAYGDYRDCTELYEPSNTILKIESLDFKKIDCIIISLLNCRVTERVTF